MSHTIYSDSFTSISDSDHFKDGHLFTAPLDIETTSYPHVALAPFLGPAAGATPGFQYGLVQGVESPAPPLVISGHNGLWSDGYTQGLNLPGPYPTMDNFNYPPPASYPHNVGVDDLPHPTPGLAEYHGDRTHDARYYIPIAPGPLQIESYAPMAPLQELTDDDDVGHVPVLDNVAGPTQERPGPMPSDDEGLKRLISQYLNNPGSYVDDLHVSRGRSGGRKISITLEIDN